MNVFYDGDHDREERSSAVAIGVFDGLHRGHQAVIAQLLSCAAEVAAVPTVVTFDPSPAMVLAPKKAPRLLGTLAQRLEGLERLGVERVRVLSFNATLAAESAEDFIDRVLLKELHARAVVVGEDFHFGHNRLGTVASLRDAGSLAGFEVRAVELTGDKERFSSSSVRSALASGDLEKARRTLGYPFTLRGLVVRGDQRGTEMGFPTANIELSPHQQLPIDGVYAGATKIDARWHPAAISVGTRPQFYENGERLVEVFALGYQGDLYGQQLDTSFLTFLRPQATFESVEAFTSRLELDVEQSRENFGTFVPPGS